MFFLSRDVQLSCRVLRPFIPAWLQFRHRTYNLEQHSHCLDCFDNCAPHSTSHFVDTTMGVDLPLHFPPRRFRVRPLRGRIDEAITFHGTADHSRSSSFCASETLGQRQRIWRAVRLWWLSGKPVKSRASGKIRSPMARSLLFASS